MVVLFGVQCSGGLVVFSSLVEVYVPIHFVRLVGLMGYIFQRSLRSCWAMLMTEFEQKKCFHRIIDSSQNRRSDSLGCTYHRLHLYSTYIFTPELSSLLYAPRVCWPHGLC